jgi:periplasmic protein TonB
MKQFISFCLAVGFSFLLFALMHLLIDNDAKAYNAKPIDPISIYINDEGDPPQIKDRRLKKPELKKLQDKPKITKTKPQEPVKKPIKVALAVGSVAGFKASFKTDNLFNGFTGVNNEGEDGNSELMPRVRIEPMYSRQALLEGKEGYVTLSFDIDAQGSTTNIRVVEAKPRGYFEVNAKKALRKWKYNPKKASGKGVAVLNQSVTLAFRLDGA